MNLILTAETVARLGSFKAAAEELMITPSAVSHRVRSLEALLGATLFDRIGQGIRSTPHANRLAEAVRRAHREISAAWTEIHAETQPATLRLLCLAAFAANFILPNIDRFRQKFPQFQLDLTSALYTGSPRELRSDVLIGSGPRPGTDWWTDELMPLDMHAIMAVNPRVPMVKDGTLHGPLLAYTTDTIGWHGVAAALGLVYQPGAAIITLDSVEAACTAAERGLGVALAPVATARRLTRAGRVRSFGPPVPSGLSYWIAVKRERKALPAIAAFQRWLMNAISHADALT